MKRTIGHLTIEELAREFLTIEFPEYQREPNIWSRDQKQRLIDSILREFDIASVYFYQRTDGTKECIDGRQRLNAIMSFLGKNVDDEHNEFQLRLDNEIVKDNNNPYQVLDGKTYAEVATGAEADGLAARALGAINNYQITTVSLEDVSVPEEFNLQFLRLNLGVLINAGEKLHAMVGNMRDVVFERIGPHMFFEHVQIPTRRYTKEVTAAQVLLQAFSLQEEQSFTRARHVDLQKFFKDKADIGNTDSVVVEVEQTLNELASGVASVGERLRNRAISVSVVLLAWDYRLNWPSKWNVEKFWEFLDVFLGRLAWQRTRLGSLERDPEYAYMVDFQRHLTQASVEKPAVGTRHKILADEFERWLSSNQLGGDSGFRTRTGNEPGLS